MINTVNIKIGIGLFIILLFITMGSVIYFQSRTNKSLKDELISVKENHKWEILTYKEEVNKAETVIKTLNSTVIKFMLNKENYEFEVSEKEKELLVAKVKKQEDIKKELEKDSTPNNQLKLITVILEDFGK